MPDIPTGPVEKAGNLAKDALEAGRKLLKEGEAAGEKILKKFESATGVDVAEEGSRIVDRVKRTVDPKKVSGPVPREQVKFRETLKLDDVKVPSRPYPKTPHGNEIRALLEKYAEVRDSHFVD